MKSWEEMNDLLKAGKEEKTGEFLRHLSEEYPAELKQAKREATRTKNGICESYVFNIPVAFDIETTNDDKTEAAFMYHWQLCFNGHIITGRTWVDFFGVMGEIEKIYHLGELFKIRVYVHNLAYEAAFLLSRLHIAKLFATEEREPLYIKTREGVDFYDSFILSGLSLEKTAENLVMFKLKKMCGDLDYSKPRNSRTPLTEEEKGYCIADVTTLSAYIWEQIHDHGDDILQLPLTNTGRVRQYMRDHCLKTEKKRKMINNSEYSQFIHTLTLQPAEYQDLKAAFMGGFTHAGHLHVNEKLPDIWSMDFSSSYPGRMCEMLYPKSSGQLVYYRNIQDFRKDMKRGFLAVCLVEMQNVSDKPFPFEHYISRNKCIIAEGAIEDNGRIVSADRLSLWVTTPDLMIICRAYSAKIRILKAWRYKSGYLPPEYIECVLHFYEQKTTLKGIKDKKAEYQRFKGMNNGIYGMSVSDIVHEDISYNKTWETTPADLAESIRRYNKSKSRFDFYPWGIFITAWARFDLWAAIFELKEDYVYSDTDSVKYLNHEKHSDFFTKHNQVIRKRIRREEQRNGLTYSIPKTQEGTEKPLGEWDFDGAYSYFKTLGAKRYIYQDEDGLHITIAGINKEKGREYLEKQSDPFNAFENGLRIPAEYSGKTVARYRDQETTANVTDEYGNSEEMIEKSGVYITESDFNLSLTQQFLDYIKAGKVEGQSIRRKLS